MLCFAFQLNRVKAVEKEKDGLEGAKEEAVQYIRTENAIAIKDHVLLQRYMYVCASTRTFVLTRRLSTLHCMCIECLSDQCRGGFMMQSNNC